MDAAIPILTDPPKLPPRAADANKGHNGKIAIVAGSRGMSGAARLCGLAALRGGAGLVRVMTSSSAQPIVAASEPSLMTVALVEDEQGQVAGLSASAGLIGGVERDALDVVNRWADVVAVGPGLGQGGRVADVVRESLRAASRPVVLDADGLNAVAADGPGVFTQRNAPTVLTPHPGEMARLLAGAGLSGLCSKSDWATSDESRRAAVIEYGRASGSNVVIVLKGQRTIVRGPDALFVNRTGNAGMATGGMGDVLTGLIAALIGQGMSAFDAACLGAHTHGAAADLVMRRIGAIGYLAREVADAIPAALSEACAPRIGFVT